MQSCPKIIRCPLVPRRYCVNLFGTIWTRDKGWIDARVINHERIHTRQQRELLFLPFYLLYLLEYFLRLVMLRNHDKAYRAISFEREAYANEADREYLRRRPLFAWTRYLRHDGKGT